MNTALEVAGVALAALLSENLVLVTCMGIGTHQESFREPREAIRSGLCLTVIMVLGVLCAWLINVLILTRFGWEEFQVLAFSLLIPSCAGGWTATWPPLPPTAPLWAPPC